jgi:FkbM family methyltransferase
MFRSRNLSKSLNVLFNKFGFYILKTKNYSKMVHPGPLDLLEKFGIEPQSILHIGGHHAEEALEYKGAGIDRVTFIEGDPNVFETMMQNLAAFPEYQGICYLLSDHIGMEDFFVASNDGASSSLLAPNNHLLLEPEIQFDRAIKLPVATLDSLDVGQFDLIVVDVQGAEKLVINGGKKTFRKALALWVEVSAGELYLGDAQPSELINLMSPDFTPVFLNMGPKFWGDMLFIKK